MDHADEKRLILEILNGDAQAYAVLVARYQKPVFNMLLRMVGCRDEACDLLQDTFLRAYEHLEKFRLSARFFPWLYTIGINLARDHLRKKRTADHLKGMSSALEICQAGGAAGPLESRLDAARIPDLLAKLPEDYREALILRYHLGLEMKDIAAALGISVSGAKMRVHRGLEKLRGMLSLQSENAYLKLEN